MVNDIASNNASLAAYSAVAGQRQPPQVRTEQVSETQRPVSPAQESRAQSGGDQVTISQQARQLSAANRDNENAESARFEQSREGQPVSRAASSGAEQYQAVLRNLGSA